MDFGSKFVYNYSDSEEEVVSEEEYAEGMTPNLPDAMEVPSPPPVPSLSAAAAPRGGAGAPGGGTAAPKKAGLFSSLFGRAKSLSAAPKKDGKSHHGHKKSHHWVTDAGTGYGSRRGGPPSTAGRKWRRADTNVVAVKFDQLTMPSNMHTGDPVRCGGCEAVLSRISKLTGDGDERIWKCEFCAERNAVDIFDEEIPGQEDVTYMLTPAPSTAASGRSGMDESLVVFCVDTSGSMCVTTEVPGKIRFRGDHLQRLQSLNDTHESQYMPGQSRNVTYVSRLQAMQAAVDHQLGEMSGDHPSRRVALVSFSSEVTVLGDGSKEPVHFSGGKLSNYEELTQAGSELALPAAIKGTRNKLGDKVFDLEEGGQTALGPALLLSVSLACQVPGSKVIICTDGLANTGLGGLDALHDDDVYAETSSFYGQVSQMAVDKGVSVSVISMKGTTCRMVELGKVADATGGQVNIVDPLKLKEEFGNILADPILATNVTASLLLHKGLYFRNEETEESKVVRTVGNVTKETEITFEYGVRKQQRKRAATPEPEKLTEEKLDDGKPAEESAEKPAEEKPAEEKPCVKPEEKPEEKSNETPMEYDNPVYSDNQAEAPPAEQVYDNAAGAGASTSGAQAGPSTEAPSVNDLKELPFQLCIEYTDLEGARALRVLTQHKPITRDREEAERTINMPAIGMHAAQTSARWALEGKYTASRMNAFMNQRLVHRQVFQEHQPEQLDAYEKLYDNVSSIEHRCNAMQQREHGIYGAQLSDCESDDEDEGPVLASLSAKAAGGAASAEGAKAPKKKKYLRKKTVSEKTKIQRSKGVEDEEASALYLYKNVSSNAFK